MSGVRGRGCVKRARFEPDADVASAETQYCDSLESVKIADRRHVDL